MPKKHGKIYLGGAKPQPHEIVAAKRLQQEGHIVKFLKANNRSKTPDLQIDNHDLWELKSPLYAKKSTLEHIFKKAAKQSDNAIFDLTRAKGNPHRAEQTLKSLFTHSQKIKKIIVITKVSVYTLDKKR